MGKRVDFSGRSVITPDPNIELDELGVPFTVTKNLTYPEIVNDYNKDKLITLLSNGVDKYPGIKLIEKNGVKIICHNITSMILFLIMVTLLQII